MSQPGLRVSSVWFLTGILAASCTGQIGKASIAGGSAPGATSTGTGTGTTPTGTGSTGAGAGNSGAGGAGTVIAAAPRDPARVTIRRLNRAEYDNTVHDLLGTAQTPGASTFPNDAPQIGFDNNGDLQTLSPEQFSLYQAAAESLAAEAITVGSSERAQLITCSLTASSCAPTLISSFGLRAFRRPLTTAEVNNYVALMASAAQAGATTDEQFRTVLEAMLVSPNFLFRPEFDTEPTSLTPHLLSPYELASRLSYMVYRSMPDQALFTAAAAGSMSQPADVQAQLQRMLVDPKGVFAQTFANQWLGMGAVTTQTFDATMFPEFNASLASSMGQEVTDFFSHFLQQNLPIPQLLTANFSYLDNNLATFYGVPAPSGSGLTLTTLTTPQRSGLLTMAGVLTVTSYPTRTSVVKRGAWVLGQMLCSAPPAPPANVPPFPTGTVTGTTQKEILAQHRSDPACAACHDSMDNIGLAMENYDAVGAYRTTDNGVAIDASGMFAGPIAEPSGGTGPTFTGTVQLEGAIAADPRFVPCVAQNALTYSLGRALLTTDAPYLADITTAPQTGSLGVRDVLMNVVASDTFRMRRGDPTTTTTGGMQ
jgi:hypothetical protein